MNWDLAKNESYWDQEAILAEEIHYDVVKESATALNLYEDGQLDVAIISGEIAKQMQSSDQFASYPSATMNYIRLNQERKDNRHLYKMKIYEKLSHWPLIKRILSIILWQMDPNP